MKTYLKNVCFCLLCLGVFLVECGQLELGKAVVRAQLGISDAGMNLAPLAVVAIGGAVKTFRDWRKKRREAGIISVLLADTIQKQREKLVSIDAEEPSAGRARRRAMCNITLIALEEKAGPADQGKKNGGAKMKAVLASVKPEWWEKILSGEKTLEIRKSTPQSKDGRAFRWPLTVLVYVSGTGAVQGQFTCPGWIKTNMLEMLVERSGVKLEDLRTYAKGREPLRVDGGEPGEI